MFTSLSPRVSRVASFTFAFMSNASSFDSILSLPCCAASCGIPKAPEARALPVELLAVPRNIFGMFLRMSSSQSSW